MYDRYKKVVVILVVATSLLLGSNVANAAAASKYKRIELGVKSCVAEIGKRTDYGNASRVLHLVVSTEQVNLIELKMDIKTTLYSGRDNLVLEQYLTSCVTGTLSKLVKFRIYQEVAEG